LVPVISLLNVLGPYSSILFLLRDLWQNANEITQEEEKVELMTCNAFQIFIFYESIILYFSILKENISLGVRDHAYNPWHLESSDRKIVVWDQPETKVQNLPKEQTKAKKKKEKKTWVWLKL
jgi:hypothetical protein